MDRRRILILAATSGLGVALPARAQAFPTRTITLVVPYGAGSTNDVLARIFGAKLATILSVPVVVDNRPGANTAIGALAVSHAPPDGYTLLLTTAATTVQNPLLFKKLSYAPASFVPVSQITRNGNMALVSSMSVPAKSVTEFVAYARHGGRHLNYASIGNGSTHHIYMELLKKKADIDMLHVPYKSSSEALLGLVGGEIAVMFTGVTIAAEQQKSGKLRVLAVTGTEHVTGLADVPTMAEAGFPGFEAASWVGLFAPAKTPRAIVDTLSDASVKVIQSPDVRDKLTSQGFFLKGSTHQQFAADLERDTAMWRQVFSDSQVPMLSD